MKITRRQIAILGGFTCFELSAWYVPRLFRNRIQLLGHRGDATGIAFIEDLDMIATASADRVWRLFSTSGGSPVREISGHDGGVTSIAAFPSSNSLATASSDGTIKMWSLPRGIEQWSRNAHAGRVLAINFSANGEVLASVGTDSKWRIWKPADGTLVSEHKCSHANGCLALNPSGTEIVHNAVPNGADIVSVGTGRQRKRLSSQSGPATAACYSSDGRQFVLGESGGRLVVYDTASWRQQFECHGHQGKVNQVGFSRDDRMIWSASADRTVRCWDAMDGSGRETVIEHRESILCVAALLDDAVATGSTDNTAIVWSHPWR